METLSAIEKRKSIRKFQNKIVPRETIEKLLRLASKAPSGKNRQPWRFVVLENRSKAELVNIMDNVAKLYKEQNKSMGSFDLSINAISEASAVILVFNAFANVEKNYTHYRSLTDTQSIGAAIQTLLLAACDFGLGTLWICDVFYCDYEICSWLNRQDELVAAVAIGYPNQTPHPRPRKLINEVVEWKS